MKKLFILLTLLLSLVGCAELPQDDQAEPREVMAHPIDIENECQGELAPTGKFVTAVQCGQTVHVMQDENGQIWYFTNNCGIDQFQSIDTSSLDGLDIYSLPSCSPD